MTWYPAWVVALEKVSKGDPHAVVCQTDAQDAIRAIRELTAERNMARQNAAILQGKYQDAAAALDQCTREIERMALIRGCARALVAALDDDSRVPEGDKAGHSYELDQLRAALNQGGES